MPKLGMEPIRRAALIEATIAEIGSAGSLDITVSQIARRAGMSSALAHHYFGGKDQIFLAAMRHTMSQHGIEAKRALKAARAPRDRVVAIVEAGFTPENFLPDTIAAWLNFYVLAASSTDAKRLLTIYHKRLQSNLRHALRPLLGSKSGEVARRVAALIDGIYLHHGLARDVPDGDAAARSVMEYIDLECLARRN